MNIEQKIANLEIVKYNSLLFSLLMKDRWDNEDRKREIEYRTRYNELCEVYRNKYHSNPLIDECETRLDVIQLRKELEEV